MHHIWHYAPCCHGSHPLQSWQAPSVPSAWKWDFVDMISSAWRWLERAFPEKIKLSHWITDISLYESRMNKLTRWCWKNVVKEKHASPIFRNTCKTFDADAPETKMAMHNRKFPAGIFVPTISGWLFQMTSFFWHFGLAQVVVTSTIVPTLLVSTRGFSLLQVKQNLNSINSWDMKTMYFGSVRKLSPWT